MRIMSTLAGLLVLSLGVTAAPAQQPKLEVKAAVLKVDYNVPRPLSRLDIPPEEDGFGGARTGTMDNATTGRFLGHTYETLEKDTVPEEAIAALDALAADGVRFVVVMAEAEELLALADHAAGKELLLFNAQARDTRLRSAECRANVFHIAPSRAMVADGLAQYMVWKRWTDWLLVHGSHERDKLMAEAYRRAAKKFGAKIVEERIFEDTGGARRSDSGHVLVQKQIPVFMQRAEEHDAVIVADESRVFGAYIPYRTWDPRPVAGDAGLVASNWHPAHEGWGATQVQRRFEKLNARQMTDLDYQVWLSLRVLGEAVTRTSSADVTAVRDYIRSDEFETAAFKGQPLTVRPWNNQLRQGIILADGRLVVSVSPQAEFLHRRTRLDTLGLDEPESDCSF